MSVEELKKTVATLSPGEQNELTAFLFHLRHRGDVAYQAILKARVNDKDPSHWLTPEEFEKRLDAKYAQVEPYQVYLNVDLLEVVPKSGPQRQEIMKFIYSLRDRPRTKGDYTDNDARSKPARSKSSVTMRSRTDWMMR